MNTTIRNLLVSTALTIPMASVAVAQDSDAEVCNQLAQAIEQGRLDGVDLNVADVEAAVSDGNVEQCEIYFAQLGTDDETVTETQAADAELEVETTGEETDMAEATAVDSETATVTLQDQATIAGTVYLEQSPPNVDVQGGNAEVDVSSATPEVTVRENQAQIVVRQAAANITVDMPQPTIRIEQPAPEIIITMPDPSVDVANVRPQVDVRQAPPTITVTQAQPRVDLELEAVEDGEEGGFDVANRATGESYQMGEGSDEAREVADANVTQTENEPVVNYLDAEDQQANVSIERQQPSVRVESAEPNVQFASSGEPSVEYVQSGEATVTFEQAAADPAATGAEGDETQTAAADMSDEDMQEGDATDEAVAAADQAATEADQAAAEATEVADTAAQDVEQATEDAGQEVAEAGDEAEAMAEDAGQEMAEAGDDAEAMVEDAGQETADAAGSAAPGGPMIERDGYVAANFDTLEADTLLDRGIFGVNDERIGDIGDIALSQDGAIEAIIVEVGGFLGIGEKDVALPFDEITILQSEDGSDIRIYVDYTEDELENMQEAG